MAEYIIWVHWVITAGLIFALATVLANLACFDRLVAAGAWLGEPPLVSILVPARNEAQNIEACVSSLLAQDYPCFELIVLDDHSEDQTAALACALGLALDTEHARQPYRLVSGSPLPTGWVGKNWACHQLAGKATGAYLFFTDADTVHAPGTVAALVAYAQRNRASLVSAWPKLITKTWGEKLVIPLVLFLGMAFYPHWLLRLLQATSLGAYLPARARRTLGAANGQSMFFRRDAYDSIGGHASVRAHLVEDVALGRAIALQMNRGLRLLNCEAIGLSTCRMYRNFPEVWEGFTKNARPAFESSVLGFIALGVWQFGLFVFPFAVLIGAGTYWRWAAWEVSLVYLIRFLLALRFKSSWLGALLHPVGNLLGIAIALNSWRLTLAGGVSWKGRRYGGR